MPAPHRLACAALLALAAAPALPAIAAPPSQPAIAAAPGQPAIADAGPARLYHRDGRPATVADVVAAAREADVVFLGEHHDDPAAHALERELFEALAPGVGAKRADGRPVALALEMFERDVQPVLDEYLADEVREKDFLAAARPWKNYEPDYRPLVEAARARGVPVIAANAPARYVSRVGRLGLAGLGALRPPAPSWLAPSPLPSPSQAYLAKLRAFVADAGGPGHMPGGEAAARRMAEAQWLRDTTMAASVAAWLGRTGGLVVHVAGIFHVAGGLGTPEALRAYRPAARALVVAMVRDAGYPAFAPATMAAQGDFVAVTPGERPPSPAPR